MRKSIYIIGPTASGKSDLAIAIAKDFNGEVISCDSRQIYRGMDIGTGKEPGEMQKMTRSAQHIKKHGKSTIKAYISGDIPHYLIDTHHPNTLYSAGKFVAQAKRITRDIEARGKITIICGGTMFWAQALLEGESFSQVPPNPTLRKQLEKKSTETLLSEIKKKDPVRYASLNTKDERNNRVRLVRALEIITAKGKVTTQKKPDYASLSKNALILAPKISPERLKSNIEKRLKKRLDAGMLKEVSRLHSVQKISWPRLESFGLEYTWSKKLLCGEIVHKEFVLRLTAAIWQYAKRQCTWIKRWEKNGAKIHEVKNTQEASALVKEFVSKIH